MSTLTKKQIKAINEARLALREVQRDWPETVEDGRLVTHADIAEDALFDLLNVARSYCGIAVADAEMHLPYPEHADRAGEAGARE